MATAADSSSPTPRTPEPADDSGRSRLVPYAIVAAVGLAIWLGIVFAADRDPFAWGMPPLVLTVLIILFASLADRRGEEQAMRESAAEAGLEYDGIRPIPSVTPLLEHVTAPAHVLTGDLGPGGPWVRVARTGDQVVAIIDAPVDRIHPATRTWLDKHPLGPRAEIGDDLLVVSLPRDTPYVALLDVTRQLNDRL